LMDNNCSGSDSLLSGLSHVELAFLIIEALVLLANLMVFGFILVIRNYEPLKARHIPLLGVSIFAGTIWWIGCLANLGFVDYSNQITYFCSIWAVWFQIVLGAILWVCSTFFRLLRLHFLKRLHVFSNSSLISFFLGFWSPVIVYGVVGSVLEVDGPEMNPIDECLFCEFDLTAWYGFLMLLGLYIFGIFIFAILAQGMKGYYKKEWREILISIGVFLVAFFIYCVLVGLEYISEPWGRIFCSVIVVGIQSFHFYLFAGAPVFYWIYDRERYLKDFQLCNQEQDDGSVELSV
jgi:hypothetical protein